MDISEAKRRARAGSSLLFARRLVVVAVTMVSTVTIARLIPPQAYGLANMSAVLLAFAQIFRDFGLTSALMRKTEIDQRELSFIFWFNAVLTIALTATIAAGASAAARFYHESVVRDVILVSLIGFLFSGLSLQHVAMLNRNLRFGAVALIEIVSLLLGFAATLTLAIIRHDVWSIVIGTLVQLVSSALMFVAASRWRPSRPARPAELGSLLRFGANTSLFTLSTFLSNNIAVIVIGHFLGAGSLGQYNRAQALYALPTSNLVQPIAQATMPLLTRLRHHPLEYRAAYLGMVRQVSAFVMPLAVILAISGVALVEMLLGPKWHEAGYVLTALAPALAGMGLAYAAGDLFVTQDRSAELRTIGIIELILRVSTVVIAVRYGLVAAAIGFTIATLLAVGLRLFVAGSRGPVTRLDQLAAVVPGIYMAIGALLGDGIASLALAYHALSSALSAGVLIGSGSLGAFALGMIFPGARAALLELAHVYGLARLFAILSRRTSRAAVDRAISG